MNITLIGIDLAKNVFQVCGVNCAGKPVFNKQIRRHKLFEFIAQYPETAIAMEACGGSNYWGREFKNLGHKVMLIPPQHVKPFVKGNKNDRNDAFAITEAANRPNIHCVEPRTLEQTDIMQQHKLRERLVKQRVSLINQLRGFLSEYGIIVAQGKESLFSALPHILEDSENGLTVSSRQLIQRFLTEWRQLNDAIKEQDKIITQQCKTNEAANRLTGIRGVGSQIATVIVAHAGNGSNYKNGRHFAANLGLVPKEHSSGGKQSTGSITKRGNDYIRRILVQGSWSVIKYMNKNDDKLSCWARKLVERRGKQKAVVAIAHKIARIMWSMLYHGTEYKAV